MTRNEVEQVAQFASGLRELLDDIQNQLISTTHSYNQGDIMTLISNVVSEVDILDEHSRFLDDVEFANSIRPKTPQAPKE